MSRSDADDIANALASVVTVGPDAVPADFVDTVLPQLRPRPQREPDPAVIESLRQLGETQMLSESLVSATSSLCVTVDFIDLVDRYDMAEAWKILGELKDLLG